MTVEDRRRLAADRSGLVTAAREHSLAVAQHLDRIALRLRDHARPVAGAGPMPALGELSTLLLADASMEGVLRAVLDLASGAVEACDAASVTLVQGGRAETPAATHPRAAESDRCQYDLREGPCYEAATSAVDLLAPSLPDHRWPRFSACADTLGWGGLLSVPLVTRAGLVGALNLYAVRPGAFGEADVAVARTLARHAATALINARDFREQQATATTLQRFLLPASLPQVRGLELTAHYRPASSGINVGGDWYDVLSLPGGALALVIGDVAGHGVAASTTMGQLRTAVRAYALEHDDPAEVVRLTSAFLQRVEPEGYATCLFLVLDPATGGIAWCNAGHPPAVVLAPGEPARTLPAEGSVPPLGAPAAGPWTASARGVVAPGTRLLLYTDGLVERRREDPDDDLARLLRAADVRRQPLDDWCHDVIGQLLGGREVGDDVAVLAVEIGPRVTP